MVTRRNFLKTASLGFAGFSFCPGVSVAENQVREVANEDLAVPSSAQQIWQDCEIGVIYHFDLPVAARKFAPNNALREALDPDLYNPTRLDTDQWIEAAKAAGAKYAVFTATHFNGFMQWQSDLYPYGVKQSHWRGGKGDVVVDFVESCRKAGIQPGIYLSTHRNAYWSVWGHYVDWGEGRGTQKQRKFNRVAEKMTEELCSRYGPLLQIWYDAGVKTPEQGGPDVLPVFEKYQPESNFYHNRQRADYRWIGNEDGYADYPCWATMPGGPQSHNAPKWRPILGTGDPEGTSWSPGMVDVPIRGAHGVHNWFWHPDQDYAVHPVDDLVEMYYRSVGRNCNFIIGEVITPEGLVPQSDIDHLAKLGREIRRRFKEPVMETRGKGNRVEIKLPQPQPVNHVMIIEDIARGERIRRYTMEGLTQNNRWQKLCEGQSVGHKRIQKFPEVNLSGIRLLVKKSIAPPHIRKLAIYRG